MPVSRSLLLPHLPTQRGGIRVQAVVHGAHGEALEPRLIEHHESGLDDFLCIEPSQPTVSTRTYDPRVEIGKSESPDADPRAA